MSQGRDVKILGRGPAARLGDALGVARALSGLLERLGLRPVCEPQVCAVGSDEESDDGGPPREEEVGVAAACLLPAAHCTLRTWPRRGFFALDVCSVRGFDVSLVEHQLAAALGACDLQVTDVSFALAYERGVPKARRTDRRSGRDALRGWTLRSPPADAPVPPARH